jgi:hypothetical protein
MVVISLSEGSRGDGEYASSPSESENPKFLKKLRTVFILEDTHVIHKIPKKS